MNDSDHEPNSWPTVCLAGLGLVVLMTFIWSISKPFEYGSQLSRPIIAVTLSLIAATVLTCFALRSALKLEASKKQLVFFTVCVGISLRAIGLFTTPILEIDYYRYIWDGKVAALGVSPYSYSPARVLAADATDDPSYRDAVALSEKSESNFEILQRVHYPDYRTIYPPVGQFIFASTMKWFPHTANLQAHVVAIKSVMVLFDLLTMWLIYLTLARLKYHQGWLIAYAWNPLIIKEISNSGHLDSIVALSIVASVYLLTRWAQLEQFEQPDRKPVLLLLSGVALGVGVGAKIFPVVLFPALVVTIARVRWSKAMLFSLSFVATSAICLLPMYHATTNVAPNPEVQPLSDAVTTNDIGKDGLSSFLSQWRMNDVIFSALYLNLKPTANDNRPWYVVTSERFRKNIDRWLRYRNLAGDNPAFFTARLLTMTFFAIFYLWQLNRIYNATEVGINFARLTWIAVVFLILQPTLNPWYWVWIAPLACLARNPGWLMVAGFLMIYYFRFWCQTFEGTYALAGTNYSGVGLFDHGVVWVEFACIIVVLIWSARSKDWGDVPQAQNLRD